MVRRGLRRGRRTRRPRPALGGLRRLSLVSRDGPRVVRGPRDGGAAQRARGRDQGGPGGAARRRRGLHDRDPGHDRAGRLADDGVHDAGPGAVLLRHLLPQGLLPAAGPERLAGLAHPARRRDRPGQAGRRGPGRERGGHRPRAACGRRPALAAGRTPGSARPRTRRCRRSTATTTRPTAGSAARRSSRRRWCWSSCSATTSGPGPRPRCGWPRAPARRWPAAACTTSSAAGSPGTRSTPAGWSRTSRRCSTTTPCWLASTRTCGGGPAPSWPAGWRKRRATGCCASCGPARAGSRRPWTPTARAKKESSTSGGPPNCTRSSAPRTASSRRRCSASPRAARSSTAPRCCSAAPIPADADRLARVRDALLAARGGRVRPARDDKVVAAWNGLAISALAECGLLFGRPDFIAAARDAATLLATVHLAGGRLVRTSRDGTAGSTAGALEDYACTAEGFLTLSGVTGEARWMELAGQLLEVALGSFGDGQGGFFDTAADDEPLIFRPADPADNATPSGTFAVAGALLQLLGAGRLGPAPGGRRGGARRAPRHRGPVPAGGGRGPGGGRGLAGRAGRDRGGGPARGRQNPRAAPDGAARGAARRGDRPRRRHRAIWFRASWFRASWFRASWFRRCGFAEPACRCWPGAGWSTERPPRTSAASSPARPR